MSQLNVDTIKKADGTGNLSVPAETGTVVTTASPSLGRRNLIINGAMQVAQRGTSFTATGSYQYGSLDRWKSSSSSDDTYAQVAADVDGYGGKALRITTGGSGSTYALQVVENPVSVNKKTITLSWWAKASATFSQYVYVKRSSGGSLYLDTSFTNVTTSWQQFSVTMSGLETTELGSDNIEVHIGFNATATSDTYDLTMVQLEAGSVATPFEHRSYGEELALCERYFQTYGRTNGSESRLIGSKNGGTTALTGLHFRTVMRASPSLNFFGSNTDGGSFNTYCNGSATASTSWTSGYTAPHGAFMNFNSTTGSTDSAAWLDMGISTNGIGLEFDAEL